MGPVASLQQGRDKTGGPGRRAGGGDSRNLCGSCGVPRRRHRSQSLRGSECATIIEDHACVLGESRWTFVDADGRGGRASHAFEIASMLARRASLRCRTSRRQCRCSAHTQQPRCRGTQRRAQGHPPRRRARWPASSAVSVAATPECDGTWRIHDVGSCFRTRAAASCRCACSRLQLMSAGVPRYELPCTSV